MKQKDDATLSLFGDELPASDLQDADGSRKKSPNILREQVLLLMQFACCHRKYQYHFPNDDVSILAVLTI